MSSPLGGFYIAARNRNTKRQFELDSRIKITLSLSLSIKQKTVLVQEKTIYCEEDNVFKEDEFTIQVKSNLLKSGLLQLDCYMFEKDGCIGNQVVNLENGETLSTLVVGKSDVKLKVCAHN